jgi:membrane protein implicated in regulation of membrane protease activity
MTRIPLWAWVLLVAALVALDVYLIRWHWSDVAGNVEAQFILVTPAFIAHHLLLRRHLDRRHAETSGRLAAQDEAMATAHEQLAELHAFHVEGRLPDREVRPWLHQSDE